MARAKQTIIQRDFSLGETRKEFLEGDDLELRHQSLRKASNVRVLATRSLEARPGMVSVRGVSLAQDLVEIRPESDLVFGLVLGCDCLRIIDEDGAEIEHITPVPWDVSERVWAATFREDTIIGTESGTVPLHVLRYDDGNWSLSQFQFDIRPGGEIAQPYWVFEKGVTLQPSARTGSITLTASKSIFTETHVGMRLRYGRREVEITERLTGSTVRANVITTLPPSFSLLLQNAEEFRAGEAVVGADTNFQGVITAISGNSIDVVTIEHFDGPDDESDGDGKGELLVGASGASRVVTKVEISPVASTVWDEPIMSDVRGWPKAAGAASGRLFFVDFPLVPSVIVASSVRGLQDFSVGAADDDAIAREVGDATPRFLHVVSAGDVILLSDRGCYYIPTRDHGVLTPSSFNVIPFDKRGASRIPPVQVEDGVVFVESSGETIAAALLDGNVYLKWSVRTLTALHNHLIKSPVRLCGPSLNAETPEKYLFVVNEGGDAAVVSWGTSIREETAGFVPWETDGKIVSISPIFGGYWAIVDRDVDEQTLRYIERFDEDAYLDGAIVAGGSETLVALDANGTPLNANGSDLIVRVAYEALAGQTVQAYDGGWFVPEVTFNEDGTVQGDLEITPTMQFGRNFVASVAPWPKELIESPRVGFIKARVIRMSVSVQDTLGFKVRVNRDERVIGSYRFGDDLSVPPPERTKIYKFTIFGSRDHPEMEITKHEPGPFRILAIGQEVQA